MTKRHPWHGWHISHRYFGQSRDRNRGFRRNGANNRDWLSFRHCSAWSVIFSCFVRRPEDLPECCWRYHPRSSNCTAILYPSSPFLSFLFSCSWKTIQSHDPHIPQTYYHRHLGHVTGTISNKMRGDVVPSLRCGLFYIKIFSEFCSPYHWSSIAEKKTKLHKRRGDHRVKMKKSRVSDYHITESLIPSQNTVGITLEICVV